MTIMRSPKRPGAHDLPGCDELLNIGGTGKVVTGHGARKVSAPVGFDHAWSAEHSEAAGEGLHLVDGEGIIEFNGIGTTGHNLRSVA
jgi:hypothetical protein